MERDLPPRCVNPTGIFPQTSRRGGQTFLAKVHAHRPRISEQALYRASRYTVCHTHLFLFIFIFTLLIFVRWPNIVRRAPWEDKCWILIDFTDAYIEGAPIPRRLAEGGHAPEVNEFPCSTAVDMWSLGHCLSSISQIQVERNIECDLKQADPKKRPTATAVLASLKIRM